MNTPTQDWTDPKARAAYETWAAANEDEPLEAVWKRVVDAVLAARRSAGRPRLVDVAGVRTAAEEGLPAKDIAERLGCSLGAVYQISKRYGIALPKGKRGRVPGAHISVRSKERLAQLRKMADEGMLQVEAAKALGVTRQAVSLYTQRHGLQWRLFEPEGPKRLRALHAEGKTVPEMAAETGRSRSSVSQSLRAMGLTPYKPPSKADLVAERLRAGASLREAADAVGVAYQYAWNIADTRGITSYKGYRGPRNNG